MYFLASTSGKVAKHSCQDFLKCYAHLDTKTLLHESFGFLPLSCKLKFKVLLVVFS